MKKLATWSAVVALSLAFSGSALALGNELDNEGAEDGPSILPWTTSDGGTVAQGSRTLGINQRTGAWFFDMSAVVTGGGTNSLTQRVDVDGCSLSLNDVDLLGTWDASGWIVTQGSGETGDFGTMKIDFTPGPSTTDAGLQSPTAAAYVLKVAGGTIPVAATSADLTISGTADPVTQTFPDVQWDDMVFEIDCVAAFAKISGTKDLLGSGRNGRDPLYAFGGAVGTLEGEDLVGAITINYRGEPTSCTFTPTDIEYNDDTSVAIEADYECTNGDDGTAIILMTAKDGDGSCDNSDKNGKKNRGSIAVDATTDQGNGFDDEYLDIEGDDGVTGEENCLATGNVIIAGPVEE